MALSDFCIQNLHLTSMTCHELLQLLCAQHERMQPMHTPLCELHQVGNLMARDEIRKVSAALLLCKSRMVCMLSQPSRPFPMSLASMTPGEQQQPRHSQMTHCMHLPQCMIWDTEFDALLGPRTGQSQID